MLRSAGKYPDLVHLSRWIAGAIVAAAALFKLGLIGRGVFPFNSDEAIVALMARHILQGEWPIFFYGQAYMGSLDASLVALGFRLMGEQVIVIRLVQILLYTGTVFTTILLGWRIFENRLAGLVAGLVLAVPTTNFTLYTTVSLGGYGEALLLGNLLLLMSIKITMGRAGLPWYFGLGMLAGVGFWAFGLTVIYSIPAIFLVLRNDARRPKRNRNINWLGILAGMLLGLTPVIYWAISHGIGALLTELAGGAIAGTSGVSYPLQVLESFRNLLVFGSTVLFGLRPPWDVQPLFLPGLFLALAFWLAAGIYGIRERKSRHTDTDGTWLLRSLTAISILGYILTPFGGDPSGRYFLPLGVVLALLAGSFWAGASQPRSMYLRWLLLCGLIFFQFGANLEVAGEGDPGFTTQFDNRTRIDHSLDDELIAFLESREATRGYSTYWISYPLAFQSREELIFVPALPYHADLRFTERDNRYPLYSDLVEKAGRVAFITAGQINLDRVLISFFREQHLQWSEGRIGPYHVFYDLDGNLDLAELKARWNP